MHERLELVLELVMDRAVLAETRLSLRATQPTLAQLPRVGALSDRASIRRARKALHAWRRNLRKRVHVHSWRRRRVRNDETPVLPLCGSLHS